MSDERIKHREQTAPEKAREHLKNIRALFRNEELDVLLFGSRTRNSHTANSDFDISIVKTIPDSTGEEDMRRLYQPYYNHVSRVLYEAYPNARTPSRAIIMNLDGYKFSVTPKFRRESNTRDLMHIDNEGNWRTNNPVDVMLTSKFKQEKTKGRFLETIRDIMKKLTEHSLEISNFVMASVICHVEDSVFLQHDDREERVRAVLEWLAKQLESRDSSEWGSMDNGEQIFVTRPGDFQLVKQCVRILLEDYEKKNT